MSDLQKRNTAAMISATERFSAQVGELKLMVVAQNAKITALGNELASLKQKAILQAVADRLEATGHGGTA